MTKTMRSDGVVAGLNNYTSEPIVLFSFQSGNLNKSASGATHMYLELASKASEMS